jgi:hypothetical protein
MCLVTILLIILAILILAEVFLVGWAIGFARSDNSFNELLEVSRQQNEMWYNFSGELIEMLRYDGEGICPCCGADMRGDKNG